MSSHWSSPGSLWQTFGLRSASSSSSCLPKGHTSSAPQLLYVSCALHEVQLLIFHYQTHWVNFGLKALYLALLALQFVLALGNRPKGERMTYNITLWVYAILAVYLLVCSFWLTALSFKVCLHSRLTRAFLELNRLQSIPDKLKDKTTSQVIASFFEPPIGALIAAILSTFGIWLIAALLYVCDIPA